jgi:ferric-dicitrate binding protein FerR (iron transport regulator)
MTTQPRPELCAEVAANLAEILDGTASAPLYEHLAECDTCRDARHDAEQARALAVAAGADHQPASELEERVLAALEREQEQTAPHGRRGREQGEPKQAEPKQAEPKQAEPKQAELDLGKQRRSDRRITGAVLLLVAAAAVVVAFRGVKPEPRGASRGWSATLERAVSAGGGARVLACAVDGTACRDLAAGAAVPADARVKTDATTRAELRFADGSVLTLDHDTDLALTGERRVRLASGALVADIAHAESEARVDVPVGSVTVHGTKFALRARADAATVDVSRGVVTLADRSEHRVRVNEGETGRLEAGSTPSVGFSSALGETFGWSDETFEAERSEAATARGLGELHAKKPGQTEERSNAVTLASHRVRVRIAGAVARTEIEEVFENTTGDVLEGIYRFPLPPGAQLERLALDVDGKLEEGAFVDRDRAAAIFRGAIVNAAPKAPRPLDDIVWVPGPWRDPALLEWQRGGRFELHVFPIPKHGSRRVVLAYTEVVNPSGDRRRYTYPLAYDPSGTTRVRDFSLDVEVRGHDAALGVRPSGYALERAPSSAGVSAFRFAASDFVPAGNLELEYALPRAASELTAWAYYGGRAASTKPSGAKAGANKSGSGMNELATAGGDETAPYVALALRPRWPAPEHAGGDAVAIVVDASRSMLGEAYERASELAARIVRELAASDRVVVLACGVDCEKLPGGERAPSAATAAEVRRFLRGVVPEDASDLVGSVERALASIDAADGRSRRVIYLGDGAPTVGEVRPGSIERAVARYASRAQASVVAVGVGSDADPLTLGALARGGGGVLLPYAPGSTSAEMAYAVLAASHGSALAHVEVELPAGLYAVAPAELPSIPAGGEAIVLARMDNFETRGDVVLRGTVGGKAFERRYPVELRASESAGNAFVPRRDAAARLAVLERDGSPAAKTESIALSTRFNVASRYTSLLVLESEAMLSAFGLDRATSRPAFTGEDEADATSGADDEAAGDDAEQAGAELDKSTPATGGPGAGLAALESSAKRASSAPKPKSERGAGSGNEALDGLSSRSFAAPPAPRAMLPAPAATVAAPEPARERKSADVLLDEPDEPFVRREQPLRRYVPMRRVWERRGEFFPERRVPSAANADAVELAERDAREHENRRDAVKKLFTLLLQAGELERAALVAERWSDKEPLDPEALTARADVLAASGERARATRVLGSVLDARPGDVGALKRLARLERWAGRPALGCRFSIAGAEVRSADAALLAEAVLCARETQDVPAADELLSAAPASTRDAAERLLALPPPDEAALRGDLRVVASWHDDVDLDFALVDPDGHRVSWLGAPTRGVITARAVTSHGEEALALSGGKPGEYALEVVRSGGAGTVRGELTVTAAGTTRRVPFSLDGGHARLGIVKISMHSRLVPL